MVRMGYTRKQSKRNPKLPKNIGPSQCHPRLNSVSEGCLPAKILTDAVKSLNLKAAGSPRKALEAHLGVQPGNERSFLMALPISTDIKDRLEKEYLRPAMPEEWKNDPDTWLDSNNIADVLNQYEEAYPKFEFMGPFPIDFAAPDPYNKMVQKCLMTEICELRIAKALQNGTESIGIVYNLDPHFKSGSHWVANFIDIKNKQCYYFDSYGMEPPPQVAKFMKWLTTQDPGMKLSYSSRRLQYKNTECGVYSTYFIIRMLLGESFTNFSRRKPTDSDMLQLRKCMFST